jgi:putative peptidoglycan lipid II flippase
MIVSIARAIAAVLALALGILSARYFGTSVDKDCYLVAQAIPSLVAAILLGGAYTSLLLALADIGQREGASGQNAFAWKIIRRIALALMPLALGVVLFSRPIVGTVAPGFAPPQIELAARLLPITTISAAGMVLLALLRCLFETRSRFALTGLTSVLIPTISLLTLVAFVSRIGIFTLAIGPLLGTGLALALVASVARRGLQDPPGGGLRAIDLEATSAHHRRLWVAFVPMSLATNFGQINLLIDNAFASLLPTGSIAVLGFAFVIVMNAEQLTTFTVGEVIFPRLAAAALRSQEELAATLRAGLRYMVLMTAPLAAGVLTFGRPLARMLFERGEFGPDATLRLAGALACYSLDILIAGYVFLFARVLLSRGGLGFAAWTACGAVAAKALLNYLLMRPFGINGIALATVLVSLFHLLALAPRVRREVSVIHTPEDIAMLVRVLSTAAIMGAVVTAWAWGFERSFDVSKELPRFLEVLIGLALGGATYVGLLRLLRVEEARVLMARLLTLVTSPAQR